MSRLLRPLALRVPLSRAASSTSIPIPTARFASSFLQTGPSPPRLPPDQQAEFERLQRAAEAALSSHTTMSTSTSSPTAVEQPETMPLTTSRHVSVPAGSGSATAQVNATSAGSFSGGIRQGAPPEFDGDKNPKTGEVGGPKNEPLRWGGQSDWSFNGRVTDF